MPPSDEQWLRFVQDLAEARAEIRALAQRVETLVRQIDKIEKEVDSINDMANRWKGVTAFLLGLGGLMGGFVALWGKIKGGG